MCPTLFLKSLESRLTFPPILTNGEQKSMKHFKIDFSFSCSLLYILIHVYCHSPVFFHSFPFISYEYESSRWMVTEGRLPVWRQVEVRSVLIFLHFFPEFCRNWFEWPGVSVYPEHWSVHFCQVFQQYDFVITCMTHIIWLIWFIIDEETRSQSLKIVSAREVDILKK